ncbi:MAG: hypothetical protein O3B24_10290, partial [Verrucomicrobia bacterium]|nr:hypothetical protein [Verrucomicrobiota bacterium]
VEIYTNGPSITTQTVLTTTGIVLDWDSIPNRIYDVYGRGGMTGKFSTLQGGLPASPPLNTYTSAIGTNRIYYYRIGVQEPVYP